MFKKIWYPIVILFLLGAIVAPYITFTSGEKSVSSERDVRLVFKDNVFGDAIKGLVARNCTNPLNKPEDLPPTNTLSSGYLDSYKKKVGGADVLNDKYVRITGLTNNGRFNRATASGDSIAYCYNYRPFGSVGDLDGDGHVDFFSTSSGVGGLNIFFSNGDGTFISIKDTPLVAKLEMFKSMTFSMPGVGDFNGDGISDLALVPIRNKGSDIKFVMVYGAKDRANIRVVESKSSANPYLKQENFYFNGVTVGDMNNDGKPDLIVDENFTPFILDYTGSSTTDGSVAGFKVYMGTGDESNPFVDVTLKWGFTSVKRQKDSARFSLADMLPFEPAYTYQANISDLDGDGFVDVIVIADFGSTTVYYGGVKNGETFFRYKADAFPGNDRAQWMSTSIMDVNQDGLPDVFLTDVAWRNNNCPGDGRPCDTTKLGNALLVNQGNRKFVNEASKYGVLRTGWAWGSSPIDLNNDGRSDLIVGNGMPAMTRTQDSWQFSNEKPYILLAKDDGKFRDITQSQSEQFNPELVLSTIVPIDANEDGAMDFIAYSAAYQKPVLVLNKSVVNNSVTIEAEYSKNGKSGYCWSCKVTVKSENGENTLWQGSFGRSYGAQGQLPLVFGLGKSKRVVAYVTFPDKSVKRYALKANRKYKLSNN